MSRPIFSSYPSAPKDMTFYSVAIGRVSGIYPTWSECEKQTKGFANAAYFKGYSSLFYALLLSLKCTPAMERI